MASSQLVSQRTKVVLQELVRPLTAAGANLAYDLEQEEILGDSFLKFACSVFVFFTRGEVLDEGRLTTLRSRYYSTMNVRQVDVGIKVLFLGQDSWKQKS